MRSEAGKIRKWRRESEKQDEDQDKPKLEGFVLRCRGGFDWWKLLCKTET